MDKMIEALEIAQETHSKINFKGSKTDELLFKFLGQIIKTLKEDAEKYDSTVQ
tara:strand:- start:192 stop:350 length:159 start_codon:yes stop_codon:yes gene_type:complete